MPALLTGFTVSETMPTAECNSRQTIAIAISAKCQRPQSYPWRLGQSRVSDSIWRMGCTVSETARSQACKDSGQVASSSLGQTLARGCSLRGLPVQPLLGRTSLRLAPVTRFDGPLDVGKQGLEAS